LTTLAKSKAKTSETFMVQVSLTIVTNDRQNMFVVQAAGHHLLELVFFTKNVGADLIVGRVVSS
jgi:hypothetical protein